MASPVPSASSSTNMEKSRDHDITFIGATVDKLGVNEGGPLGDVELLVDLLAPGRLPEREPDYVVPDLQVINASLN